MPRSFAAPRLALALLPLALSVGCYANEEDDPGLHEFRATASCSSCGLGSTNSPTINSFEIPELHLDGHLNDDGVSLGMIIDPDGKEFRLRVINEEFAVMTGGQTLSGADLLGWTIRLDSPGGTYDLEITKHESHASLANAGPAISAYGLKYESHETPGEFLSVCPNSQPEESVVTLILGETYDRELKTVTPGQSAWFTLACADEAAFKMKAMNYGPNADFNNTGAPATVQQRQAPLKMITADYCGSGVSYTVQGTPLIWHDTANTVGPENVPTPNMREAYWNADGAMCLDTPRFVDNSEVKEECDLPACSEIDPSQRVWATITP